MERRALFLRLGRTGVLLLVLLVLNTTAQAQCQNQLCAWNGTDCWQCGAGRGFGCRVDSCRSCTNTSCGDEVLLESGVSLSLSPGEVFMSNSNQHGDCRRLSGVLLERPVLIAFPNSATPQPTPTLFALRSHKGAPAVLISATHTSSDLLASARLKNVGEKTIVAYRVGWEVHSPGQKKPETTLGEWMNVPSGIPPGEFAQVPPQAVSVELARRGATRIVFFVGEVKFSDRTTWRHPKEENDRPTDSGKS